MIRYGTNNPSSPTKLDQSPDKKRVSNNVLRKYKPMIKLGHYRKVANQLDKDAKRALSKNSDNDTNNQRNKSKSGLSNNANPSLF